MNLEGIIQIKMKTIDEKFQRIAKDHKRMKCRVLGVYFSVVSNVTYCTMSASHWSRDGEIATHFSWQRSKRVTISANASLEIKFIWLPLAFLFRSHAWFVCVCLCLRAMVMHFPNQIGQKRFNLTKASSMTIFMPHIRIIQFTFFFALSAESNISTSKCITFNALALVHMANAFDSELTEQAI